MTFQLPVAHWSEPPTAGNTGFAGLSPYLTAAGYWVFLPTVTAPPAGDTRGALIATGSYNTLTTSTTSGRAIRRNGVGMLFLR